MDQCETCGGYFGVHRGWCTPDKRMPSPAPEGPQPYTADDVFPWAWDGPLSGSGLMECGLCGAAVASTDTHVEWHNSQRTDLPTT